MRKRDSIEFLWDELKSFLPENYTVDESVKILSILKQARAMHQEEMINFTTDWHHHGLLSLGVLVSKSVEEHYNKTFNQ